MALKNVLSWCSGVPQLGWGDLYSRRSGISFNCRKEVGGVCKWESYGVSRVQRPIMCIEDENQLAPKVEVEKIVDQKENFKSKEFQKDFSSLRRPLSATNVSVFPSDSSNIRVAYQGIPGAYSEVAALKAFPQCEAVPCDKFEAAFKAVELCLADKAVLPIENSLEGSILQNYDLLFHHSLHIVGEVKLAVDHCLLGLPGVRKEDLKRVLSHPQALAQCELTLSKLGVVKESMDDTTGAAQFIASNKLRDTGAIASARAALSYGLNILAERIQDDSNNITRFLILAREPIIPRTDRPFKTSIVFTLVEGPGVLCRALSIFALRDINLTKIECRPQTKQHMSRIVDDNNGSFKLFESIFYIDFEASMAEVRAQNVLEHLQEFASFLRVLGSYPVDTTI